MDVYIQGKRYRFQPLDAKLHGGEADIFRKPDDRTVAVKIFKSPDHPDLRGNRAPMRAAEERLKEHQRKLRDFPKSLPARVIQPIDLVTDSKGQVLGYTMTFLDKAELFKRYAERSFRQQGISQDEMRDILLDLHRTTAALHARRVVIGDLNDLNILVEGTAAHLIDADSFQFGPYFCRAYTVGFIDPLCCDRQAKQQILVMPHTEDSDWYAYSVLVMESLLCLARGPYGGVFQPKQKRAYIPDEHRPLKRITVFHPEVIYPRPALPIESLSDELLSYLETVFVKDRRETFPKVLLEALHFERCPHCQLEHARTYCPLCQTPRVKPKLTIQVTGRLIVREVMRTPGLLLAATTSGGKLRYLYHEGGVFRRENHERLVAGPLRPGLKTLIQAEWSILAEGNSLVVLRANEVVDRRAVDRFRTEPIVASNSEHRFWLEQGHLLRDQPLGTTQIATLIADASLIWVGETLGFAISLAGGYQSASLFGTRDLWVKCVSLPRLVGQLIEAAAAVSDKFVWWMATLRDRGHTYYQYAVINAQGETVAERRFREAEFPWLPLLAHGAAAGTFLFLPTDDGLIRLEVRGGEIVVTATFPETAREIDSGSRLLIGGEGIYVINPQTIRELVLT